MRLHFNQLPPPLLHSLLVATTTITLLILLLPASTEAVRKYTRSHIRQLREDVRHMFQFAYQGYLDHAADYDELRPLSCDGVNTWGSYSLTLIDALDTLAVMGNYTEFGRVTALLQARHQGGSAAASSSSSASSSTMFDSDINVSVFETNIRIVGGLLGAHLLSHRAGVELEPGWPCNGPLLRMAEDVAARLLPAFDTATGMPYGTVNLRHGVPPGETTVTCTAGVGTFLVEFGALSRLTGNPVYEEVALNAVYAMQRFRSPIGLFGNHIDVQTGRWTAQDAGIGSGVDSFYEYLVKGALMLNRPELMALFAENKVAVDRYLKRDDWHVWVGMNKGQVTLPVFQSLEAYWPGVLSLYGDTAAAMKSLHNYHSVWRQYGFLPEFYNIPNAEAGANRENYPLRPELIESAMYLYRATGDPYLLQVGEDMLRSIQHSAKTACGYATIKNVRDHSTDNRMESFFLAETTKYLYLLFDPDNELNNDGGHGTVIATPHGECLIGAGGYVFNTEAHAIDVGALRCCHDEQRNPLAGYANAAARIAGERFSVARKAAMAGVESTAAAAGESVAGAAAAVVVAEADTQLNAPPAVVETSAELRRKATITTAMVQLATADTTVHHDDVETVTLRRNIIAEIRAALKESGEFNDAVMQEVEAKVTRNYGKIVGGEQQQRLSAPDDSLIVSTDAVENATDEEKRAQLADVDADDDLITVDDEDDGESDGGRTAQKAVVTLSTASRDADDNRSSSSSTTSSNASTTPHPEDNNVVASEAEAAAEINHDDDGAYAVDHDDRDDNKAARAHFDQESYIRDITLNATALSRDDNNNPHHAAAAAGPTGLITDFVQAMLRSKLPAASTFSAQRLLERVRQMDRRANVTQDFRLLTCRTQPFLQRLAVMGEFFW